MRAPFGRIAAAVGTLMTAGAVALVAAAPATAAPAAETAPGTLTSTVTGTFTDAAGGTGTFTGAFAPESFAVADDQVVATGVLTGTLVDSAGSQVGTVDQPLSAPVVGATGSEPAGASTAALASCQILDLVLGPLDLDLLGLVVHLDQVHLNITAESGPGNLLGNLLCAVVGLFDGGQLAELSAILNQILAILGGLGV